MQNMTEYEKNILETAVYFTAVRGATPRHRTRKQFNTIECAVSWAKTHGDNRTMIYAVNAYGRDAHIRNA